MTRQVDHVSRFLLLAIFLATCPIQTLHNTTLSRFIEVNENERRLAHPIETFDSLTINI